MATNCGRGKRRLQRCPYCKRPVTVQRNSRQPVIYHLDSCAPSRKWLPKEAKYQIEIELPDILHGGIINLFDPPVASGGK